MISAVDAAAGAGDSSMLMPDIGISDQELLNLSGWLGKNEKKLKDGTLQCLTTFFKLSLRVLTLVAQQCHLHCRYC